MRNMSFMLTKDQIRNRTKDVTRRLGWWFLKAGDIVMACEKCQGLKRGEKIKKITPIRIVSAKAEPLFAISQEDVEREGFPGFLVIDFIQMFMREMKCVHGETVNRIEFEYLEGNEDG